MKKTRINNPAISIIVPVYNSEKYLQDCLDSIYNQTYDNYELILVNDGSNDNSLNILNDNAKKRHNIVVIDQTNHGQGYARNRALDIAKGKYILFIDSDDLIEPSTLQVCIDRIEKDDSDLVHFEWKLLNDNPSIRRPYSYHNAEPFAHKYMLVGGECDELLQIKNYFSVNNLYRKSFLDKNNIRYGEGYLYEDNIFLVLVANRAEKISIEQSPLYIVRKNEQSSTRDKRSHKTTIHADSFSRAVHESVLSFTPRSKYSAYFLQKYFLEKLLVYYKIRVPVRYRHKFIKSFTNAISMLSINTPKDRPEKILNLFSRLKAYKNRRYLLVHGVVFSKIYLRPIVVKWVRRIKKMARRSEAVPSKRRLAFERSLKKPDSSIVFLGFDYRYSGNSRYLFDEIINNPQFKGVEIKYITDNTAVDDSKRISPRNDNLLTILAGSKIIIAESWVSKRIIKNSDGHIVQLWHGTPLKKMFFDSPEPDVVKHNINHKKDKYKDIMSWDYLVADSPIAEDKFASAFLFDKDRLIKEGYPRVRYVKDLIGNNRHINGLKKKYNIPLNKKIILYAPTWRDYNYKVSKNKQNFSYIIDVNALSSKLGNDYVVAYHGHHFMVGADESYTKGVLDVTDIDIQDMLLISNHLITDYSSVLFDALNINLPLTIYANDFALYSKSRGVYEDIWGDLKPLMRHNINEVVSSIKKPNTLRLPDRYQDYGRGELINIIDRLLKE
jgi:CDP-glycerol glycerophosphotransferase